MKRRKAKKLVKLEWQQSSKENRNEKKNVQSTIDDITGKRISLLYIYPLSSRSWLFRSSDVRMQATNQLSIRTFSQFQYFKCHTDHTRIGIIVCCALFSPIIISCDFIFASICFRSNFLSNLIKYAAHVLISYSIKCNQCCASLFAAAKLRTNTIKPHSVCYFRFKRITLAVSFARPDSIVSSFIFCFVHSFVAILTAVCLVFWLSMKYSCLCFVSLNLTVAVAAHELSLTRRKSKSQTSARVYHPTTIIRSLSVLIWRLFCGVVVKKEYYNDITSSSLPRNHHTKHTKRDSK